MTFKLIEQTEKQLRDTIQQNEELIAIYFYTPTCGTCKLAERMLEIAIQAGDTIPVYKINVNFAPWFVRKWEIKSIPCLMIFKHHTLTKMIFALQSVQDIFSEIRKD